MEKEYRHAIFPWIYRISCFFRITERDIAEFFLSYYQNKVVFGLGLMYIDRKLVFCGNIGKIIKNIHAKWEICVIWKDCDEVYTCHTNSVPCISHAV